ncbi:DUF2336 domain-containing protein, partial [Sneathiella sp.]|uniref:DUF2336 domain-containing protein n=1 Tax=Sneathiella sp. TaxID=1964365 RepID=UPI0039E3E614
MAESKEAELDQLMVLSRDGSISARQRLFDNMTNLFLAEEERLSEQERAHISDILSKLIQDIELNVRRSLAEKLAVSGKAPAELVKLLANDAIEVARPILLKSRVLLEPDLMELVETRSKEHLLVISNREDLSEAVSDQLIEFGDEDVIESLIRNSDAEVSKEAMAYLVEESKRLDRFQEPLLARHDLPSALAHQMFWWVSAALRRHIIENFEIDQFALDQHISSATREFQEEPSITEFGETHADKLVAQLASRNELSEMFLVQSLQSKQIRLFIAGLSLKSGLSTQTLSRFLFDKNAEGMAVTCKALDFDR